MWPGIFTWLFRLCAFDRNAGRCAPSHCAPCRCRAGFMVGGERAPVVRSERFWNLRYRRWVTFGCNKSILELAGCARVPKAVDSAFLALLWRSRDRRAGDWRASSRGGSRRVSSYAPAYHLLPFRSARFARHVCPARSIRSVRSARPVLPTRAFRCRVASRWMGDGRVRPNEPVDCGAGFPGCRYPHRAPG